MDILDSTYNYDRLETPAPREGVIVTHAPASLPPRKPKGSCDRRLSILALLLIESEPFSAYPVVFTICVS